MVRTPAGPVDLPASDAAQRAVVDHRGGPLLVLAGPGTGKTTTLVEAVARRVCEGADPERVLVLTFSRKAAVELRDRMTARLARAADAGALTAPQATTFHSYCYALVRAHQDADLFAEPLRLLTGPEQDLHIRELLEGQIALERRGRATVRWPDELRACLTTRGFADEVRAVLARSRELGLGPAALEAFARRAGRPDWRAAAGFFAEYLDVLDAQGVLDYAELVHRAALLTERDEVASWLDGAYDAVYVDEYQDTDPAQARLLRALAGGGARTLVAFGDPDQSIYAFRGADVNGILDFPDVFRQPSGAPAPVRVLRTAHRFAPPLSAATRRLTERMPLTRLPAEAVRAHRALVPAPAPGVPSPRVADRRPGSTEAQSSLPERESSAGRQSLPEGGPPSGRGHERAAHERPVHEGALPERAGARPAAAGRVEVFTYPTAGAELENIADVLRRAHLEEGVPWAEMAVLVRAGGRSLPVVRRALVSAGVPVDVDGDDVPLRHEPAIAPLLTALRVAAEGALEERASLPTDTALTLLSSPLGGMDAADLRRLGRALREEERAVGARVPRPSDVLLAEALAEPERLVAHTPQSLATSAAPGGRSVEGAHGLGLLLRKTRELLAGGGTAEEALWTLWTGTGWPDRLERAARRGGTGGRNADRDLDAVCTLFAVAARAEERGGGRGALNFLAELEAQDIAADTLVQRAVRPDAVRLLTAHRAKGREWPLVVVAGVQEGLWPDLRRRGSLLEADRIGRDGLAEPLSAGALLAEERRLFYVAATRASRRLVVTAVRAQAEDGDQPSRFLAELGVEPRQVAGRPRRPLSVPALVAELRATTVDPQASPALRDAAARRLARLAGERDEEGYALVPAAHPQRWWGLAEPTRSAMPLRDRDQPVALSGSALEQLARTCSLQWFLTREVKADEPATAAQGFGNVVHVLADEVASGSSPADLSVLMERLDAVWDGLAFEAPWKSRQEKESARAALERFLRWHVMERGEGREPAGSEHGFEVTLRAGEHAVRIRGSMDRVERDAQGRAYVVDFKTGRARPTGPEVERHPQLAVYQLAVREGAADALFDGRRPEPGGAELVHLRIGAAKRDGGDALPVVQRQEPEGGPSGAPDGPDGAPDGPDGAPAPDGAPERFGTDASHGGSGDSGVPGVSGGSGGDWVGDLLATAAARVLDERFTPTPGQHCAHCAFRSACSARPEGRQIVE
ncbi:ATP-dependent helicase [Streptomyces tubbatahanensis]|uniref:DNA 3'-5' helicase n=1 Tax=Streptomyces tubbatahanensis TaxID=2923272 RepID=A0ABY3Y3U2_9ACTN|nr:ATP-dependent DNA helicase [Streptomyces tubbatahanensis]UNT01193.1 ATP-dependent helicase [Streptomyces tubbatahanensis]